MRYTSVCLTAICLILSGCIFPGFEQVEYYFTVRTGTYDDSGQWIVYQNTDIRPGRSISVDWSEHHDWWDRSEADWQSISDDRVRTGWNVLYIYDPAMSLWGKDIRVVITL